MKKSILNIGKALSSLELKQTFGGAPGGDFICESTFNFCNPNNTDLCNPQEVCNLHVGRCMCPDDLFDL